MSAISNVLTGFRLFAGEKLNEIITQVNNLTGNGTVTGGVVVDSGKFDWSASGKARTSSLPMCRRCCRRPGM